MSGESFPFNFAGESDPSSFLTDRSGKLLRNDDAQDMAPGHQEADRPNGGIRFLLVRRQFDPDASGIVGIEDRGEQYVTFVNPANLRLRILLLTKKHPYAMQVRPSPADYDRHTGIFVDLHCIDPAFLFRMVPQASSLRAPVSGYRPGYSSV
jgi:hypothetical protein